MLRPPRVITLDDANKYLQDVHRHLASTGTDISTEAMNVTGNLTLTASQYLNPAPGNLINVASGVTLTIPSPDNILSPKTQQIFSGAGTVVFTNAGTISPCWYPGTDMAAKVQAIITAQNTIDTGDPLVIEIPSCSRDTEWDWGSQVVINRNGHFILRGDGRTILNVTANLDSCIDLGTTVKLNECKVHDLVFDLNDYTVTDVIRFASGTYTHIHDVYATRGSTDSGSCSHVLKIDSSIHTGSDGSSGFVGCTFRNIGPTGNSVVTDSGIYSIGGQVQTIIEGARAVSGCPAFKVYLSAGYSFQSNLIINSWGASGSSYPVIVLDTGAGDTGDAIAENIILGVTGSGKYGVLVRQANAAIVTENKILGLKHEDWDTQALYVCYNDGSDHEAYKTTYIYANQWGDGPELDSGTPCTFQYYHAGDAEWKSVVGNIAKAKNIYREGKQIFDNTNGTLWTYQNSTWESSVIKAIWDASDDVAYRIAIPERIQEGFFAHIAGEDSDQKKMTIVACAATGAVAYCVSVFSGADVAQTTGALLGTTGSDNKLNISTHTDNYLYIENRTGATRQIAVSISQ